MIKVCFFFKKKKKDILVIFSLSSGSFPFSHFCPQGLVLGPEDSAIYGGEQSGLQMNICSRRLNSAASTLTWTLPSGLNHFSRRTNLRGNRILPKYFWFILPPLQLFFIWTGLLSGDKSIGNFWLGSTGWSDDLVVGLGTNWGYCTIWTRGNWHQQEKRWRPFGVI